MITTLLKVTDDWLSALDRGMYNSAALIDLRKAFDIVKPSLVLNKLSSNGVSYACLPWFSSYLTGRRISTLFNYSTSAEINIDYGVLKLNIKTMIRKYEMHSLQSTLV